MKSQWVRRGSEDKLILLKHYKDRQTGLHQNCKLCCEYQQARKQSFLYVLTPKPTHKSCVIRVLAPPVGKQHLWHKKKSQAQKSLQRKTGDGQRAQRKISLSLIIETGTQKQAKTTNVPIITRMSNNKLTKTETETHTLLVEMLNVMPLSQVYHVTRYTSG